MVTKRRTRREPAVAPVHRRFTADEYERLVRVGVLAEDERVELFGGEIVCMSPIGVRTRPA